MWVVSVLQLCGDDNTTGLIEQHNELFQHSIPVHGLLISQHLYIYIYVHIYKPLELFKSTAS